MRFLPGVGVHVGLEMIRAGELLFAYVTLEGANSGMLTAVTHMHTDTDTHTCTQTHRHTNTHTHCLTVLCEEDQYPQSHSLHSLLPLMGKGGVEQQVHRTQVEEKEGGE